MLFKEFVEQITVRPEKVKLKVCGKEKRIRGMARFTSRNLYPDEYVKIVFEDHSHMVVSLSDETLFFADRIVGLVENVTDEEVGVVEKIKYEGKEFGLDNANDYQFCLQVYCGKPGENIEGEVEFSDYMYENADELEMLSLGKAVMDGKRADVWVKEIGLEEVEFVNR